MEAAAQPPNRSGPAIHAWRFAVGAVTWIRRRGRTEQRLPGEEEERELVLGEDWCTTEAAEAGKPSSQNHPISRPPKPSQLDNCARQQSLLFSFLITKLYMLVGKKPINTDMYKVQYKSPP